MRNDNIKEIQIDDLGRLRIYPEQEVFTLIWRSATEVHWDEKDLFLYSPKPGEWTYLDWYKHIVSVIKECNCALVLTDDTEWRNVPLPLKTEICTSQS